MKDQKYDDLVKRVRQTPHGKPVGEKKLVTYIGCDGERLIITDRSVMNTLAEWARKRDLLHQLKARTEDLLESLGDVIGDHNSPKYVTNRIRIYNAFTDSKVALEDEMQILATEICDWLSYRVSFCESEEVEEEEIR